VALVTADELKEARKLIADLDRAEPSWREAGVLTTARLLAAALEAPPLTLPKVIEWLKSSPATYQQLVEGAVVASEWTARSGFYERRRVLPCGHAPGERVAAAFDWHTAPGWVPWVYPGITLGICKTHRAAQLAVDAALIEAGWTLVRGVE
jgi:hypothetical protein